MSAPHNNPSLFEILTKLFLPALSLAAYILAEVRGQQTFRWPLLGLVVLFVAMSFSPSLITKIRDRLLLRRQAALARRLFPELQRLVGRFGKFVENTSVETLHAILQREAPSILNDVHVPNAELLYYPWYYLSRRMQRQRGTKTEFLDCLDELDSLVRRFDLDYVLPVFERMPERLQQTLSSSARRELAVLRERFVHYLQECTTFREKAQPLLPEHHTIFGFPMPRPLS